MEDVRGRPLRRRARILRAVGQAVGDSAGCVHDDVDGGRIAPDAGCPVQMVLTVIPHDGGYVERASGADEIVEVLPPRGGFAVGRGRIVFADQKGNGSEIVSNQL